MTALIYVDHGLKCNEDGCIVVFWGSELRLSSGMTLRYVRRLAGFRGWRTGVRLPRRKMDDHEIRTGDFCPVHAGHPGSCLLLA